jgi:hypothetical protein
VTVVDPLRLAADLLDPPDIDVFGLCGYTPDPAQQRFHAATEFDVGYGGIAGAGKSMALLMDGIKACVDHPGIKAGIFRRSYDELRESILEKVVLMQDPLREHFGARYRDSPPPELRFANGSFIVFRYAENMVDVTRRQGGEYQWVGIDERQQVGPGIAQYLRTRIRSGRVGLPELGIRSTFNPGDVGHADLKERYVDRTRMGAEVYHELDPETNEPMRDPETGELTGRYIRFVRGERSSHINRSYWNDLAADPDPVRRRQLAEGDWDAGGGLMFSETWRRSVHVVSPEQVPVPVGAAVVRGRGVDYGMSAPFCCLWGAKLTDDLVVVYRELYKAGLTPDEQAKLILASESPSERQGTTTALDPACWTAYATAPRRPGVPPKSIAADYAAVGVSVVKAQNDRIGGVRLVHDALRVRADGMPRLLVYDTCPNLIRQLGGLPRSKVNPEDVDTHAEDHAYDALRYLLYLLLGKRNNAGVQRSGGAYGVTAGMRDRVF